jgi:hypothetical protein
MCVKCGTGRIAWCTSLDDHQSEPPTFAEFVAYANSLPRIKRTELHCHPDVAPMLLEAAPAQPYEPWKPDLCARIGTIDLIVNADMQPGEWEIRENGEVTKSGRLSDAATP